MQKLSCLEGSLITILCLSEFQDAFAIRGFSKKEIDSLFSKIERDLRAGDRALNIRPTQTAQESDMRLSKPISRPR